MCSACGHNNVPCTACNVSRMNCFFSFTHPTNQMLVCQGKCSLAQPVLRADEWRSTHVHVHHVTGTSTCLHQSTYSIHTASQQATGPGNRFCQCHKTHLLAVSHAVQLPALQQHANNTSKQPPLDIWFPFYIQAHCRIEAYLGTCMHPQRVHLDDVVCGTYLHL